MILFISSFKIIDIAVPDPNISFWIVASVADVVVVNPNGIKTLLANGLGTFPVKDNAAFSNGSKSLLKILLTVLFYVIEFLITLY